jgi:uncharacterized membrane protein YccC
VSDWFANHDPGWYATRNAIRTAVVMPGVFAIATFWIGNAQTATFSAFGCLALLLFVDFGGSRSGRFGLYTMLGLAGVILITLGSLTSSPAWLAVIAMAVFAFIVLFLGVISAATAAAGRAALLSFILAVMLPGHASDIPARLAGWGLAFAIAVPVAVFVWPPRQQDNLRRRVADVCAALADMLRLRSASSSESDPVVTVAAAMRELRKAFHAGANRPVALTTGSRLLTRLSDQLEWVSTVVMNACADAPTGWSAAGLRLRSAAADVLVGSGHVIGHRGDGPQHLRRADLEANLGRLGEARHEIADETLAALEDSTAATDGDTTAGEFDRPLYAAHQLGYTIALVGETAATIGAADARSWLARVLGRPTSGTTQSELSAAEQITAGHLDSHSVSLQNSVRAAAGLAAAVLIAHLVGAQHGFWVVLGALSVVRSNALSTGTTALRALVGTVLGFAIGGSLLIVIGTSHAVLWPLLPIAVLIAGFAPSGISFTAGQAAFTIVVIILFNIIAPEGWRIGLLRVEDVAYGCLASVVAGALFWPRGAAAALGRSLGDAYETASAFFTDAVHSISGGPVPANSHDNARAASLRMDDALRQYLAERGAKHVPLTGVTALVNGASRLRLAGEALTGLRRTPGPVTDARAEPDVTIDLPDEPALPTPAVDRLRAPTDLFNRRADEIGGWYLQLGELLAGTADTLPEPAPPPPDESFLDVLLPSVHGCQDPRQAWAAERLLWAGQYVGDVGRLRGGLNGPANEIRTVRRRPWFLR